MRRWWAVPAVLGLLTVAALWSVRPADDRDGPGESDPGETNPAIALPFAEGKTLDGAPLTFVVLAPRGRAAVDNATAGHLRWQDAPGLALYTGQPGDAPRWLPRVEEAGPGPRLGLDGHNGTRITVHVFDEAGVLVASNAPPNETRRFAPRAQPEVLPGGTWYVGANETAPNGTRPVPGMARPLFHQLRPLMEGLPVGGVASLRSDAYASIYGSLYVTVRIDGLAHAP